MKKPFKICVLGTHGTGKSTLVFKLAAHYKGLGKNVKVIQEVARSCPFPINENMTVETALWIYYEHSKKELEACRNTDIVISDRSSLDSFIYAEHFGIKIPETLRESAETHLKGFYDLVIWPRPDLPIHDDCVRSSDKEFQRQIDELFDKAQVFMLDAETVTMSSSSIFTENEWKYCLPRQQSQPSLALT